MSDSCSLKPKEASFIAANAYFALAGWEKRYQFNMSGASGKAPAVQRGAASSTVVQRNIVGAGPRSVAQAGINNGSVLKTMSGSTGSNLVGRVKTGFGYMMQFERGGKKHLVIATRGTRPELGYPDLLTDANISTGRHFPGIGPVHSGFYDTYKSLAISLNAASSEIQAADVVHCVGHSLGGAVANLVAVHIRKKGANVKLYTFGAPRVGLKSASYDRKMNALLGEDNIYRVSHSQDPVPMIPIAPYIHVHPHVNDKNNLHLASPIPNVSMENHDTNRYIASMADKDWGGIRAAKLQEADVDRHYFQSWTNDENWLKSTLGIAGNAGIAMLSRVLRGMLAKAGHAVTEVATILDLVALTLRSGLEYVSGIWASAKRFLGECARVVGLGMAMSKTALRILMNKLVGELKIAAKLAIATAHRVAKSKEFEVFLISASAGSIGFVLI